MQWVGSWVGQYGLYLVWGLGSPLLLSTVEENLHICLMSTELFCFLQIVWRLGQVGDNGWIVILTKTLLWSPKTKSYGDIVFVSVRPFVRPVRFPSFLKRMHRRNYLKSGMLVYPDHPQKWFNFGQYWPNVVARMPRNFLKFGFHVIQRKCKKGMV